MRITKSQIDKIASPSPGPKGKGRQEFYRDDIIPGFGLRVTSGGAKSFIVEKRINGKVKRITLGRYGNLTVEQARKEAMALLGEVAKGNDPIRERAARNAKSITFSEAFEDYILTRKNLKDSTISDYRRSVDGPLKGWRTLALVDISKDMVELKHREYGKRSPARANNAMRVTRAIFNHAMAKYEDSDGKPVITMNPVDRISRNRAWYKIERRQTYIKPHRLSAWFQATEKLNNETTREYIQLLLFTGLRRSEAARMEWVDIDFDDKTITIPKTKNNRVHVLPMSDFLETLLSRRFEEQSSPFVFPADSERGYLVDPRFSVERVGNLSGVTFTLHDLRRTFITLAESLDLPAYALKRLLNHKDPNDVTAGYVVYDVNRLRKPMQRVTDYLLQEIEAGRPAKVIPLRKIS